MKDESRVSGSISKVRKQGRVRLFALLLGLGVSAPGLAVVGTDFYQPFFQRHGSYGIGARATGMAGAFTAVADDGSAVYWNPAGMVQVPYWLISLGSSPFYFKQEYGMPYYSQLGLSFPLAKDVILSLGSNRALHPLENFHTNTTGYTTGELIHVPDSNRIKSSYFQAIETFGTFAAKITGNKAFSLGVTVKKIDNDKYFIKYTGADAGLQNSLQAPIDLGGWGADLGFLYRIPLSKYDKELRIGVRFRDMISRVIYFQKVTIQDSAGNPVATFGKGLNVDLPQVVTLALAYRNNHLFKLENVTAFDFDQINDLSLAPSQNKYIHAGTEFWMFNHHFAVRGGYESPLYTPGRITAGGSYRDPDYHFEADFALVFHLEDPASIQRDGSEQIWFTGSYWFGRKDEIPPPKVTARAAPATIVPSRGDKTSFEVFATEDTGIKSWELSIFNSGGDLVRKFTGEDELPRTNIKWAGESQSYEPLPVGDYTFAFRVTDLLGKMASTEPAPLKLAALEERKISRFRNPTELFNKRDSQDQESAAVRQSLSAQAKSILDAMKPTPEPSPPPTPASGPGLETYPVSGAPGAGVTGSPYVAAFSFPGLARENLQSAFLAPDAEGKKVFTVQYSSNTTDMDRILDQVAGVLEAAVRQAGPSNIDRVEQRVSFGGQNGLFVSTPVGAAGGYSSGRLNAQQVLAASTVLLNGAPYSPAPRP